MKESNIHALHGVAPDKKTYKLTPFFRGDCQFAEFLETLRVREIMFYITLKVIFRAVDV